MLLFKIQTLEYIPFALTIGGFGITNKTNVIADNKFYNENKVILIAKKQKKMVRVCACTGIDWHGLQS